MTKQRHIAKAFNLTGGEVSPVVLSGIGRRGLYKLWAEMGVKIGCEVGVQRGRNSYVLLETIPGLKLFLVEPWANHPNAQSVWEEKFLLKVKRQTLARLAGRNIVLLEDFSENAIKLVPDNYLDFVYIDGDHTYDFAMLDIIMWNRKVKRGGIISGHDYYYPHGKVDRPPKKVTAAVNHYVAAHRITPLYITDKYVPSRERGDAFPSWMWIKK